MITQHLNAADVSASPFPHMVVHDVLTESICQHLMGELPSWETIAKGRSPGNNLRFNYTAAEIQQDPMIAAAWKEFARRHTSQDFLDGIVSVFQQHITNEYQHLAQMLGTLRAGVRHIDDFTTADVLLDAQIGINTPVTRPGSVRGPHLDNPRKLFVGLLYLRADEDDSTGGHLQLYSPTTRCVLDEDYNLPRESTSVKETVEYRRNSLVLFLNSLRSLHGVTPRGVTPHPRWFINLIGEMREPLFTVNRRQRLSWTQRLLKPFRRRAAA